MDTDTNQGDNATTSGACLDKALQAHHAGRIAEAQTLYRALLKTSPRHPVALQLLGVSHSQQGQPEIGIPYFEEALALKPDYADAHINLANAFAALKRFEEAIMHYEKAVALEPDAADAHNNLGASLAELKRYDEAIPHYERVLALKPDFAETHNNLGVALAALNRHDQAIASYSKALTLRPDYAEAHNNLGASLVELNRYDEAIARYQKALALKPDYAEAHNNLGIVLGELDRHDEAIVHYKKALALKPDYVDAHTNLGVSLGALNRFDEAIVCYERALALNPDHSDTYSNLGVVLRAQNRHDEAIVRYEKALALKPDHARTAMNKSHAMLCLGRFKEGWQLYEARSHLKENIVRSDFNLPLWLGEESIAGKTLLIQCEQGLGDAIQMLRYVPLLERLGVRCWIQAPPRLMALTQRSFPQARVIAADQCPAEIQFRIPVMSLPLATKTFAESDIPNAIPYLVADEQKSKQWTSRLANQRRPTVGLVWRGNPLNKGDHNRSLKLEALMPLLARREIQFIALQKDLTQTESRELSGHDNVMVLDKEQESFDDAAAIMSALNVLISVDSSPAHLSGALGKATWVLLPFSPDWRWLLGRSDSPWYPTARLFRQASIGDWANVIHELDDALACLPQ